MVNEPRCASICIPTSPPDKTGLRDAPKLQRAEEKLSSNPIRLQDYVKGRGRAHASKVVLFGWIPASVPLPEEVCGLTRCEPRLPRARGRLDQHAEVKNVSELRSRGVCTVEQQDRFRGKLGRNPLQWIRAVIARTRQKIEGKPTRGATRPQRLDRFAR